MIRAKYKPKWYELRMWLARSLVRLAEKIAPTHPDVMAFHIQQMSDMMILGGAVTRIDPMSMYTETSDGETR